MTRVAILQSCYIPWKGYFDIIGSVDVFVVYDDVQYRKNHWHNRNLLKTQHGVKWLTVPVSKSEGAFRNIRDIHIAEPFAEKHWTSIAQAYARAPYYAFYAGMIQDLYEDAAGLTSLSDLNVLFLKSISGALGFDTRFVMSHDLNVSGGKTERLVEICRNFGATSYLSGPAAKGYLDVRMFQESSIEVEWADYSGYPDYPQLHASFAHAVSILDVLFNAGPEARRYMKAPEVMATGV